MLGEYEAAVDSESSLTNSCACREIPNLQPDEVSLLLDKISEMVCLYRRVKCKQGNVLYLEQHTIAQVNQHCDPERFSCRQLVCLHPWAITSLRHQLMEVRAFLLTELRRNYVLFPLRSLNWRTVLQPWVSEHKASPGEEQEPSQEMSANTGVGNRVAATTCKEADGSPREDGWSTGRGLNEDGTMELIQALAEGGSDLRSKKTVPA